MEAINYEYYFYYEVNILIEILVEIQIIVRAVFMPAIFGQKG
jgi:hypothetical protein